MLQDKKSQANQKYTVDYSLKKYKTRYARLMNILFYAKELPSDLYRQMNMSYDNFRKAVAILKHRGLISKIHKDRAIGYKLSRKAKRLTAQHPEYMKYRDQIDEAVDRHHCIKRRNRKRQFAYLYALFDRIGLSYETDKKPRIEDISTLDERVYFYTANDLKRMLGVESNTFKGSRLYGFLIGGGKIIPVYRTNKMIKTFGRHEGLVPLFLSQHFSVRPDTAILICDDDEAVIDITNQIIDNVGNDPKNGANTAQYDYFYLLPSDDSFLSRFNDLYDDHNAIERSLIERYNINTSDKDANGRYRFKIGTGFIKDSPILIYTGNVVTLKVFILNAEHNDNWSYILCKKRDFAVLKEITKDRPIEVVAIED